MVPWEDIQTMLQRIEIENVCKYFRTSEQMVFRYTQLWPSTHRDGPDKQIQTHRSKKLETQYNSTLEAPKLFRKISAEAVMFQIYIPWVPTARGVKDTNRCACFHSNPLPMPTSPRMDQQMSRY